MSVYRTGDLNADIDRRLAEEQAWEDSLPHCESCGEPQDSYIYEIDGEMLCLDCVNAKYRRNAEGYVR